MPGILRIIGCLLFLHHAEGQQTEIHHSGTRTGRTFIQRIDPPRSDVNETEDQQIPQPPQRRLLDPKARGFLSRYDPEAYGMLVRCEEAPLVTVFGHLTISLDPGEDFNRYILGGDETDLAESLNTLVHEICHTYTDRLAWSEAKRSGLRIEMGDGLSCFFIEDSVSILVRETPVFETRRIHADFPGHLKTERYATYVYPSNPMMGTQKKGLYGLLDEWNAYYHGTRAVLAAYPWYQEAAVHSPQVWLDFFDHFHSTYFAHAEFKLFMMRYLMLAQKRHPGIYRRIMQNEPFKRTFVIVDSLFSGLVSSFLVKKSEILSSLASEGFSVNQDEQYLFIGREGRGHFMDIYRRLMEEIEKPEYRSLMDDLSR